MDSQKNNTREDYLDLKQEFYRYFSFWKLFLVSLIFSLSCSYLYIRYSQKSYESFAKIEIIDKAQDSEMSLPSAMTVFNRSMINLENEMGVLNSYAIHKRACESLNANVRYFTEGNIKTTENHHSEWYEDYNLDFKIDTDKINSSNSYVFEIFDNELEITHYDRKGDFQKKYSFNNLSTLDVNDDLPFEFELNSFDLTVESNQGKKILELPAMTNIIDFYRSKTVIKENGRDSDQLVLSLILNNRIIADDYLNVLISEFDKDGIVDRQSEYKRTIDFVDSRSNLLLEELKLIENRKESFKKDNKISDIIVDVNYNITQKLEYDNELFQAESQKDLVKYLTESISQTQYELLPMNIGIEDNSINSLIENFNLSVRERNRFLVSAGENNSFIRALDRDLMDIKENIYKSINKYEIILNETVKNLKEKEVELTSLVSDIPEKEKILRSIERELEIKEKLFLLLLQKKEEASINYAVVKPSIKVIDYARSSIYPISPVPNIIYLAGLFSGFAIPFLFLYIKFTLDSKIHTREHLAAGLNYSNPIIGEIPFLDKINDNNLYNGNSRDPLSESIRMVIANLNFILFKDTKDIEENKNNSILVTSSIKAEGKTLISTNIAKALSNNTKKVLLIGSDLRNPQIHKIFKKEKTEKGVSDYITNSNENNWRKFVNNFDGLDVIFSGTIPPNPTEILSTEKYKNMLEEAKSEYDYVIIDSAPCLLVSDTFEISKYVSKTVYVVRSNFSEKNLFDYINDLVKNKKLPDVSFILNSVGSSHSYGYSYGYQYGYRYSYKYGYNYGYGYGYSASKN